MLLLLLLLLLLRLYLLLLMKLLLLLLLLLLHIRIENKRLVMRATIRARPSRRSTGVDEITVVVTIVVVVAQLSSHNNAFKSKTAVLTFFLL